MSNDRLVTRVFVVQEIISEKEYLDESAETVRTKIVADELYADARKRSHHVKITTATSVVSER